DLSDAGSKAFSTREDLQTWLTGEVDFWSWAQKNPPTDLGLADDKRSEFVGWVRRARDDFSSATAEAISSGERILDLYAKSGLVSSSARAQFIDALRSSKRGEIVAQAALAEYLGSAQDPNPGRQSQKYRYPSARGRVAIALFDAGVDSQAVAAVSQSI